MSMLFSRIGLAASLVLGAAAHAAGDFTVQNGTWVVTSEVDGKPGRGMAVDVQDGIFVMQVYNYEANGEPTFHLTSGPIADNHFEGILTRYRGGRHYGSGPLEGVEAGSPGTVEVRFTSASTGTVRFPGEQAVGISRFRFNGVASGALTPPGVNEVWAVAELDDNRTPVGMWTLGLRSDPQPDGTLRTRLVSATSSAGTLAEASTCTPQAGGVFRCGFQLRDGKGAVSMDLRTELDGLSGTVTRGGAANTNRRLVGGRLTASGPDQTVADVPVAAPSQAATVLPEPGTWVVSPELNGRPGRGMAVDVQNGTFVMQVYNYEANGAPTFHLATGPFADGQAVASLIRYSGGRFFGSGALSGRESANAGEVAISFTSATTGHVRFPGEPSVPIQRFLFGATQQPQPESLLGRWAFQDGEKFDSFDMTTVVGNHVEGGGKRCAYENTAHGTVRCTEAFSISGRGTVYTADYRFTPGTSGRALGASMEIDGQGRPTANARSAAVVRAVDRNGSLTGLGQMGQPEPGPVTVQRTLDYSTTGPDGVARASRAIVTRRNVEERRPVIVFAPGWGGVGDVAAGNSNQANILAAQGYVAVDLGFHQAGGAWTSDIAYSAQAALDKLCTDMPQFADCSAIIWVGTSYAGSQSLIVTRYLRSAGRPVLGFVSQDAGYTLHWNAPSHADLASHSVALIENQGDSTFPIDACDPFGNCGARERATWHRNSGMHTDKIVSWCPAGGEHGTRNNVPGGGQGWDNWVSSAIKTMLHVQRGVPTFTNYTPPVTAVSNACVRP